MRYRYLRLKNSRIKQSNSCSCPSKSAKCLSQSLPFASLSSMHVLQQSSSSKAVLRALNFS